MLLFFFDLPYWGEPMSLVKVTGLAIALFAITTSPLLAARTTQTSDKQMANKPAAIQVACRAGTSWFGGGVFPIYGTRGGRTGVIDVLYVDPGCYREY
jgi:hypothetical protein